MAISGGLIAGIVIVALLAVLLLAGIIYYIIRQSAKDDESCAKLLNKYKYTKPQPGQRSEMVSSYPEVSRSFIRAPVAGQQFTPRELKGVEGSEFVIPARSQAGLEEVEDGTTKSSMYSPIDPAGIDPRLYTRGGQELEGGAPVKTGGKRPAQVIFAVEYDPRFSILKITLLEARHLRPSSSSGTSDPYCTVGVTPGHGEKQSKVHRKTTDPIFNESFSFEVPKLEVSDKTIEIKFYDFDQYSRHECTGTVTQKMRELDLKEGKIDLWRKINLVRSDTSETPEEYGDILLRLGYLPSAEKLTVVLLKARNLKLLGTDEDLRQPDPYIRVAILHDGSLLKKKKTSTKRKTTNPTYNQAINFAVPLDVLPQVEIQFHVVHDTGVKIQRGSRKETIGYLEIGPHSKNEEYDHWVDLMSNKPQARWHRLQKAVEGLDESTTSEAEKPSTSAAK